MFSGGDGITVYNPNGTICFNGPAIAGYAWLTYDPANSEVLEAPDDGSSTGTLYHADDFEPGTWTKGTSGSWQSGNNWSLATTPNNGTVTFADDPSGPITITLDGNQSAGALVFDSSGTNGYTLSQGTGSGALTLGTSSGASIAVVSGTHSIAAPLVLAGSVVITLAGDTQLTICGNISESSAGSRYSVNLSGPGTLILSGSNIYTGGTNVEDGTLDADHSNSLPEGSSLTVGDGGDSLFDAPALSA